MGVLEDAVDIAELGQSNLWVIYGKSGSGKTAISSTFPKPMLYLRVGDDGSNTIAKVDGIKAIPVSDGDSLKNYLKELTSMKKLPFKSVVIDTFSMITNVWIETNVTLKKKKMTQQMWGDLKQETEETIKLAHLLSQRCAVILTCHETTDSIEGMEEEILPDVRASVTKGARTYLEGMANYGIHTTKISKERSVDGEVKEEIKFAIHLGANPYYWTKAQIDPSIKLPKLMINPTYRKIMKLINNETKKED